jgi:hypothetical protein
MPPSYKFESLSLFPAPVKPTPEHIPTVAQSRLWHWQLKLFYLHTFPQLDTKLRALSGLGGPNARLTPNDYKRIATDLCYLAERCLFLNLYVAHLAHTIINTRENLEFIDYIKAAGRHLSKAEDLIAVVTSKLCGDADEGGKLFCTITIRCKYYAK